MNTDQEIAQLRKTIDAVDERIVTMLNERARTSLLLGITRQKKIDSDPEREAEEVRHAISTNTGPLSDTAIEQIYKQIVDVYREIEHGK